MSAASDVPQTAAPANPFALVGYFESAPDIYKACEGLRDAGYKNFDAHTPFPVHGLENAMGLRPSRLPWIVLVMGVTGFASGLLMQIWMSVIDYPMIIGGKPFLTLPSYVPVCFELTILFSAFGTFFGMWGLNRLPRYFHPVMQHPQFGRASDDLFFVSVESTDPNYDSSRTRQMLEKLGARDVIEVMP